MDPVFAIPVAALGVVIAGVAFADAVVSVLHPTRHGRLSARVDRIVWWAMRGRGGRAPAGLRAVGPVALGLTILLWLTGLGVGFALVFWAFEDSVGYVGPGAAPDGWVEAVYLSGAALSTVGFGDVVAQGDALRIVAVVESGAGLATMTAAIAHLIAIYSVLSDVRSAAAHAHDLGLGDPVRATALLVHGGPAEVARLQRELILNQQHLRRYPVLLPFHPERPEESLVTLLRCAFVLRLLLQYGIDPRRLPYATDYARAFDMTLERALDDLASEVQLERRPPPAPEPEAAGETLAALRRAVAEVDPALAATHPVDLEALATSLRQGETYLSALARAHGYPHEPLVG